MSDSGEKKQFSFQEIERSINCMVHTSINVYAPLSSIIDTVEFQRLRRIKQLGLGCLVFPTANHTRFEHSLGVYHIAMLFAQKLFMMYPELVNSCDILCIAIAALIHDLGHGPFSHTFDGLFLESVAPKSKWTHEQGSIKMFRYLLEQNPDVKQTLDEYLDPIDYVFIEELIIPPKHLIKDDKWVPKGRPIEKSFLYDIISNCHEGLDVDKLDYFLRDSLTSGVPIEASSLHLTRILENIDVSMIDGLNYRRIVYRDKIVNTIASALHCRQTLHRDLYKHKTIIAIEAQLVKILQEANNHLLFPGSNGRMYKMSECIYDMCAFSKLTDSVLDIIRIYPDPNLSSARKLLDELEQRKLFKCLDTFDFQTQQEAKLGENKIIDFFEEQQIDKERYLVKYVELHQGKGLGTNPISYIWILGKNRDKGPRQPTLQMIGGSNSAGGFARLHVYIKDYNCPMNLKEKYETFISKHVSIYKDVIGPPKSPDSSPEMRRKRNRSAER